MSTAAPPEAGGCLAGVRGGRLVVVASPDGPPALVRGGEGVHLMVAGREVPQAEVRGEGDLEVRLDVVEPVVELSAHVGPGGLKATLQVTAVPGMTFALADRDPGPSITLERRADADIPAPPVQMQAVRTLLEREGITHGVDQSAVEAAVAAADGTHRIVARGTPATPPVHSELRMPFLEALAADPLHTVGRGTLLAEKTPPVPGVEGRQVNGEPIRVAQAADPPLAGGPGVERTLDADGLVRVHAVLDGRPKRAGALVVVEPRITLGGDVDVETGDVDVLASLAVTGTVGEGRTLRALHDVEVAGDVERAVVEAGGSLTVAGSCLHSSLRAGGRQAAGLHLLTELGDVVEQLRDLVGMLRQLSEGATARGQDLPVGPALLALLEGGHDHIRRNLRVAWDVLHHHEPGVFPVPLTRVLSTVHHLTVGSGILELTDIDPFDAAIRALSGQMAALRAELGPPSEMRVAYLQECEVEASGSLTITGRGIFTTDIFVGGDLRCEEAVSTLRGGCARVGGTVRVHELGGDYGARTDVILEGPTDTPDRLHVEVAHPGVHIQVGDLGEVVVEDLRRDMAVGVDEAGRVTWACGVAAPHDVLAA
jgi:hypothetical protein